MEQSKARVNLTGEFTATDLEDVIRNLAEARAGLAPEVPLQPPTELHEANILVQDETQFAFRKLATGGLRIWLRNEGLGWLAFTLSARDVLGIREFLAKESRDEPDH